eukprot:6479251-Amphidinium_carterae.1
MSRERIDPSNSQEKVHRPTSLSWEQAYSKLPFRGSNPTVLIDLFVTGGLRGDCPPPNESSKMKT